MNIKDGVTVACTGNTCDLRCPAGLKPSFNRQLKCVVTKRRKEPFKNIFDYNFRLDSVAFRSNHFRTFNRHGNQKRLRKVFIVFLMVVTKIHLIQLHHQLVVVSEVEQTTLLLGLILHLKVLLFIKNQISGVFM